MAISIKEFRQMQKDIREIKRQLARGKPKRRNGTPKPVRFIRKGSEGARADEILRRAGIPSEPTAQEKMIIAEWRLVPAEERERLIEEFRTAKFDKTLSEIVIENRR